MSSKNKQKPIELIIDYPLHCDINSNLVITENQTDNLMTPYEYACLWGFRAKQLKMGMPTSIKWEGRYDPIAIAKEEIKQGEIPLMIKRRVPDSRYEGGFRFEYWDIKDMDIRDY